MWWSAKIILSKTENVLIIPSQAITTVSWQDTVMLKQWENWIEAPVEIWDSDETNTEIISWLKTWDIVKAMFYSTEWMESMWLSTELEEIDFRDENALRENAMQNRGSWWWGWNRWWRSQWGMWWF
jgi:hypothetical protein